MAEVRQRRAEQEPRVVELSDEQAEALEKEASKPKSAKAPASNEDAYSPWLDILRVLTFLLFASTGLSYLISGGESFFWGMKQPPKYLQAHWWKSQMNGPVYMTLPELAKYDGSDPEKPLYLAINGSIYDVSANRRTYGPGGSYHAFAGADASRGFVTGCFGEDRTADMRGVEEMFLPLDDPETDAYWTAAQLAEMKKKERDEALGRAHEALAHWVGFFGKSAKYHFVGYVKRPKGWPNNEPQKPLCEQAQQGRVKRKIPKGQ